ncbi:PREDICTED: uncharacterized protein LOC104587774 isoform X2 [Nelumbo nucifera]|nr:PREDICTED: uncharacterized protein LOC104587774 isoform X2 [Nelumbo nucifera]
MERVRILKDFQISCKKRTGRALSQKKDPRVQLISLPKPRSSQNLKVNDKKVSALSLGPAENSHVAEYKVVLSMLPHSLNRQPWTNVEKENIRKGIKQQFQEMLLQKSMELYGDLEGSGDSNAFDESIASITDLEITPEKIRSFLPNVDWERLASMYVLGHSGAECEARWLNFEDPLINHNPWSNNEDKKLLFIVQQSGLYNWIDIARELGTGRTPFQCLARYQRSLNAHIMKRDWTEDDDAQLRAAVETFGEDDWQLIASNLEGRTGTQCSNRWRKTLHPARQRVGRWTADEDKRLKVAVMLFGPKTWMKIAQFVPGRTQVQCRERWVNSLDPSLNLGPWTEEEDSRLKAAILQHGYCWSKVAASVPPRTDNQCRRRWKVLYPHEVPLAQAARMIQKAALISNFVDREAERPALGPHDFLPLPGMDSKSKTMNGNNTQKEKKNSREKLKPKKKDTTTCDAGKKINSRKSRTKAQVFTEEVLRLANVNDVEASMRDDTISKKQEKVPKRHAKVSKCTKPAEENQGLSSPNDPEFLRIMDGNVQSSKGDNATLKKKNPRPKRNKHVQPVEDHQLLLLSPDNSSLLRITNGDDVDPSGGNYAISNKEKMPLVFLEGSKSTGPSKDQDIPLSPNHSPVSRMTTDVNIVETLGKESRASKKVPNPCPERKKCIITNGNNVQNSSGDNRVLRKSRKSKLSSKREKSIDSAEKHQELPLDTENSADLRVNNGETLDNVNGETIPNKKRKVLNSCRKRNKHIELAGKAQDLSLPQEQSTFDAIAAALEKPTAVVVAQQDGSKVSGTENGLCSQGNLETMDVDDASLTSLLHDALKKKVMPKPCPKRKKCTITNGDNRVLKNSRKSKLSSKREKSIEPAEKNEELLLDPVHSGDLRVSNDETLANVNGDTVPHKKRKVLSSCRKRNKHIELAGKAQDLSLPREQSAFDVTDVSLEKPTAIDSALQDSSKVSGTEDGVSQENPVTIDTDDVTLVSLLSDALKKRKLKLVCNGSQAVSFPRRKRNKILNMLSERQHPGHSTLNTMDANDVSLHGMAGREDCCEQGDLGKSTNNDSVLGTAVSNDVLSVFLLSKDLSKREPAASLQGNDVSTSTTLTEEAVSLRNLKNGLHQKSLITSSSDVLGSECGEKHQHDGNGVVPPVMHDCTTEK